MGKRRGGSRLEVNKKVKKRGGLKAFLAVIGTLFLVAAGVLVWYRFFFAVPPPVPGDDGLAHIPGEFNDDDAKLSGDRVPEGMTADDRKKDFYTILIIGLDGGVNTDTIMVASFDNANKEANIVSIPRDTLVNVQRRIKKINAAYPAGTLNGGGKAGGVAQLQREIKTIIGFIPDYFVRIDLKAFELMIDTVGGVEVDVPFHMRYDDPVQGLHINIPKGRQRLNGADALKFVRYRRGNPGFRTISDFQRIENQQAVIKALLSELLKPANIRKIPEFAGIFGDNVYADLELGNFVWFGEQLVRMRGTDALQTHTLPIAGNSGRPHWYEFVDRDAALELINNTINPFNEPIGPSHVDILTSAP
jgi:LCP family protein required for cell wall assembly